MAEDNLEDIANLALGRVALEMVGEIKRRMPVRTGDLRDSITAQRTSDGWEIGSASEIMKFVELGTEEHDIVPKNKKAMAFNWKGQPMVLKKVKHPGTKPQFIFRNVASDQAFMDKTVKKVLDSLQ